MRRGFPLPGSLTRRPGVRIRRRKAAEKCSNRPVEEGKKRAEKRRTGPRRHRCQYLPGITSPPFFKLQCFLALLSTRERAEEVTKKSSRAPAPDRPQSQKTEIHDKPAHPYPTTRGREFAFAVPVIRSARTAARGDAPVRVV